MSINDNGSVKFDCLGRLTGASVDTASNSGVLSEEKDTMDKENENKQNCGPAQYPSN